MIYRRQALTKLSVSGYNGVAEIDLTNLDLTNLDLTNIDLTNIDHWRRARLFTTSLNDRVVNKLSKGAMEQRSPIDSHAQSITSCFDLRAPIARRSVKPWL